MSFVELLPFPTILRTIKVWRKWPEGGISAIGAYGPNGSDERVIGMPGDDEEPRIFKFDGPNEHITQVQLSWSWPLGEVDMLRVLNVSNVFQAINRIIYADQISSKHPMVIRTTRRSLFGMSAIKVMLRSVTALCLDYTPTSTMTAACSQLESCVRWTWKLKRIPAGFDRKRHVLFLPLPFVCSKASTEAVLPILVQELIIPVSIDTICQSRLPDHNPGS